MELLLTVRCAAAGCAAGSEAGLGVDVQVRVRPGVGLTAAQLTDRLADLLGCPGDTLLVAGEAVPGEALVGFPPLLNGTQARLTTTTKGYAGSPPPAYRTDARVGVVDLAVVSGPDCGQRVALTPGGVSIGRGVERGLAIDDPGISREHARVDVNASGVTVRDGGSTNGTSIDEMALNGGAESITTHHRVRLGFSVLRLVSPPSRTRGHPLGNGRVRPPAPTWQSQRAQPIRLSMPTRPMAPTPTPLPWLAMLTPVPIAGVLAYFFGPHFLILAAMGPVTMGASWLQDRRRQRTRHRAAVAEFEADVAVVHERVREGLASERLALERDHPSPVGILDSAVGMGPHLWSRRPGTAHSPGNGAVRLGIGDVPTLTVTVNGEDSPAARRVTDAPVTTPWEQGLVIRGTRAQVDAALRQIVGQIVTLHDPTDLHVVTLSFGESDAQAWRWLRLVPHAVASTDPSTQLLRDLDARRGANSAAAQPSSRTSDRTTLVVVPDLPRALHEWPELARLVEHGAAAGLPVIAGAPLTSDFAGDPSPTYAGAASQRGGSPPAPGSSGSVATDAHTPTALPQLLIEPDGTAVLRCSDAPEQELIADGVGLWWARRLGQHLARLQSVRGGDRGHEAGRDVWSLHGIPAPGLGRAKAGPGTQPTDDPTSSQIREAIVDRWARPAAGGPTRSQAPRPKALIGHQGDRPWSIDLVDDGPHLLVGGTTGAGKSEFLRALVLGLALDAPASTVTFLLIDYKGGSAFGRCAELPHTVGLITDLEPALARRALTSLRAEIHYRERLLATHGTSDLDDYWSLPTDPMRPTLPRLVVVIDEFRVLAQEQPDFVAGIVRCAAVGRSLGIHLVLATQRPSGVITPDIAANVNLRVALRMRDAADSEQVIASKVAAAIDPSTPGTGWARHGSGALEEFAAVRVSGPLASERPDVEVHLLPDAGREPLSPKVPHAKAEATADRVTDEAALVHAIRAAQVSLGAPTPRPPWLPPLPADLGARWAAPLDVGKPGDPSASTLSAPWGLVDVPEEQAQRLLWWRCDEPPWRIVGGPGSGRTTTLLGLVHRLAERFGPDLLHVYAVDGAQGLAPLSHLPQVGAVVAASELGRLRQLVRRLEGELAARRAARPRHEVVVVVDEWDRLARPGAPTQEWAERIASLVLDGRGLGVHLVVAGGHLLAGSRLWRGGKIVCLGGTDPADLLLLGGRPADLEGDAAPGRGVLPEQRCAVQLGPVGEVKPGLLRRHDAPAPIDDLPTQLVWTVLKESAPTSTEELGISATDLPLKRTPLHNKGPWLGQGHEGPIRWCPDSWGRHLLIAGPAGSGRTTALRTLAESAQVSGRHTVIVSSRPGQWGDALSSADAEGVRTALTQHPGALVVIDDLDTMGGSAVEALVGELAQSVEAARGLLAVSVRQHTLSTAFRGPVPLLAQRQTALLLAPTSRHDGDALGVRLELPVSTPPGRGVLVVRGRQEEIQVAQPEAGSVVRARP